MPFGKFTNSTGAAADFTPYFAVRVLSTEGGATTPAIAAGHVILSSETISVPNNGVIHFETP